MTRHLRVAVLDRQVRWQTAHHPARLCAAPLQLNVLYGFTGCQSGLSRHMSALIMWLLP
jgi:hypothetical protein